MTRNALRGAVAALLVLAALAAGACTEPCDELAGRICNCENTADRRSACKQTFISGNPVSISGKRQDACDKYLDTCSCEALDAGNFAACGLSHEPAGAP